MEYRIHAEVGEKIMDYFDGQKVYTVTFISYTTPSRVTYQLSDELGKTINIEAAEFTSPRFAKVSQNYIDQRNIDREVRLFRRTKESILYRQDLSSEERLVIEHMFDEWMKSRNEKMKALNQETLKSF
jgi:hypothetical protein